MSFDNRDSTCVVCGERIGDRRWIAISGLGIGVGEDVVMLDVHGEEDGPSPEMTWQQRENAVPCMGMHWPDCAHLGIEAEFVDCHGAEKASQ